MNIGLLWFDNDKQRSLEDKVARAAAHYRQKYGAPPTVCFVNLGEFEAAGFSSPREGDDPLLRDLRPAALPEGETRIGGLKVMPARTVLPHHFWLGVEETR